MASAVPVKIAAELAGLVAAGEEALNTGTGQVEEQDEDGSAFQCPLADYIWGDSACTHSHLGLERWIGSLEALALEVLVEAQG
jgi:hypothetical protein